MTADAIASALGKKIGSCWRAPCLSHDDSKPSLSISERGGKLLVHCFAGCPQQTVIAALRARGLWEDKRRALIIAEYNYTENRSERLLPAVPRRPRRLGWPEASAPGSLSSSRGSRCSNRICRRRREGCRVSSRSRVRRNDEFRRRECGLVTAFHGSSAGKGSNSDPRRRPPGPSACPGHRKSTIGQRCQDCNPHTRRRERRHRLV